MARIAVSSGSRRIWGIIGVLTAALWVVLRSGTGIVPGADWHYDATPIWPARPSNPDEWYLSDSPLGILIARALGLDNLQQFLQLHAVVVVLALSVLAAWAYVVTEGDDAKWRAARLSVLAPVGAVLLTWIGRYDAFTVLIWGIALFCWASGRSTLLVGAGILLGFQHFEHSLLGATALWLTWLALRLRLPASLQQVNPLWLLPGILVGKLSLVVIFAVQGLPVTGRADWIERFFFDWTVVAISIFPLLLWSLFAGWWALVISLYLESTHRKRLLLLGAFFIGVVATLLSGDRPRVFILILVPAVALSAVAFVGSDDKNKRRKVLVEAIIWIAPPLIFWGDAVTNVNVVDPLITAFNAIFRSA